MTRVTWEVGLTGAAVDAVDIIALVASACAREPERPRSSSEDGVAIAISRADLQAAVERFGGHLTGRIAPVDRVAIMSENRIESMIAWLAVAANGGALVSINPASRARDSGHVLRDSAAPLAIVSERTAL